MYFAYLGSSYQYRRYDRYPTISGLFNTSFSSSSSFVFEEDALEDDDGFGVVAKWCRYRGFAND
tara:strand:+ start:363 stop:554 length:192 start_codon:yes stop_codon:yes gene_type:complete